MRLQLVVAAVLVVLSLSSLLVAASPRGIIPGRYIVTYKDDISTTERSRFIQSFLETSTEHKHLRTWQFGSFHASHFETSDLFASNLKSHPLIASIEPDMYVHSSAKKDDPICLVQHKATWGINRVVERKINLDGLYNYDQVAQNVDAYIIDTGILITHDEFKNATHVRASWGANFADNQNTDCNGHGTHVAGTVGGKTYGIAKQVNLIAVKVLDCDGSGSNSGVISGMQWAAQQRQKRGRPSVANMSLGGGFSSAVNNAVAAMVNAGITVVVAAGNEDSNACDGSPSSSKVAVTVGATNIQSGWDGKQQDIRSSFSNWGSCVDIFAPGSSITSSWIGSNTATKTISGTSMASPHVCGVAALYLSSHPTAVPSQVASWLGSQSTPGMIDMGCTSGSTCTASPNKLLFSACDI